MHARAPTGKSRTALEEEKRDGSGTPGSMTPPEVLNLRIVSRYRLVVDVMNE